MCDVEYAPCDFRLASKMKKSKKPKKPRRKRQRGNGRRWRSSDRQSYEGNLMKNWQPKRLLLAPQEL